MKTLKEIALELLDKYVEAEESVIYNRSAKIQYDFQKLKDERQEYIKQIEEAS